MEKSTVVSTNAVESNKRLYAKNKTKENVDLDYIILTQKIIQNIEENIPDLMFSKEFLDITSKT